MHNSCLTYIPNSFSEDGAVPVADVKQLKFALDNTLKTAFGVVGASASEFDVLSFEKIPANNSEPSRALLRVQRGGLETLRGAITMCTTLNGSCASWRFCTWATRHGHGLREVLIDVGTIHRDSDDKRYVLRSLSPTQPLQELRQRSSSRRKQSVCGCA
ncbi:hypothetical protein GQ600_27714 [Phytophthora cactorum]|nr:hypothetical protein GQ600_27714 [Phytophthora cactorum]